ncbi:hypothetical protein PYW07_014647 [Mythimna separata]|uniref:Peptidase S1 domain-containing protein n=1 Tax=Mythimna separata TaxID=271217 RepID=A0AAD8E0B4_MYTSE|nr:hypothetical protein PYW07_014647 [Mythimna separata]
MVLTWRLITKVLIIITFTRLVTSLRLTQRPNPQDWQVIETLAEEHPYLVGLLSGTRDYICTGTIINRRTILTSGSCVSYNPIYVLITAALYNKKISNRSVFDVAYTKLHTDYIFDQKTLDPNVTRMHSNIGLVIVKRPVLEIFVVAVDIGNYYASELKDKKLIVVGYGRLDSSDTVALQYQAYHQTPCTNPKWYYCVCGIEYSTHTKTYNYEFGTGAPVLLGQQLVGVTATPCGTLSMKNLGIRYNIFTVIGPYLPWIEKSQPKMSPKKPVKMMQASTHPLQPSLLLTVVCILLVISKTLL